MIYTTDENGWQIAVQDLPTYLGDATTPEVRYTGSMVAVKRGGRGYWHDPDGFLVPDPHYKHYVWLCGTWQEVEFRFFGPSNFPPDPLPQREILVHVNVQVNDDGTVTASVPLTEEV